MLKKKKEAKYPSNLMLKALVKRSGYKTEFLAKKLGISRPLLALTLNGHRKSTRIVTELTEFLAK